MDAVDVPSPMPATVVEVLVAAGDSVTAEQELIILESMKMEVPVEAPVSGTIAEVLVEDGVSVAEGDIIFRITPA